MCVKGGGGGGLWPICWYLQIYRQLYICKDLPLSFVFASASFYVKFFFICGSSYITCISTGTN